MTALGVPYVVKKGDTLWDIAERELGSPLEWPRIYALNNRDSVIQSGIRRIDDPDLIFAGETIRIPRKSNDVEIGRPIRRPFRPPLPTPPEICTIDPPGDGTSTTSERPFKLRDLLDKTYVPFAVTYDLTQLPQAKARAPGYTMTIRLAGSLTIKLGKQVPLTYVHKSGLQTSLKAQADSVLGQLLSETDVGFNPGTKAVSFVNKLTWIGASGGPKMAVAVAMSSDKPVPVLRAEITYPPISGNLAGNLFFSPNFKVVLEVEPEAQIVAPTRRVAPATRHAPSNGVWVIAGGAVLLVGIIAIDFYSAGTLSGFTAAGVPIALTMMGVGITEEFVHGPHIVGGSPVRIR